MKKDPFEALFLIEEVEELRQLLVMRWELRMLYGYFQDAAMQTRNTVFLDYMELVAGMGTSVNQDLLRYAKGVDERHAGIDAWEKDPRAKNLTS